MSSTREEQDTMQKIDLIELLGGMLRSCRHLLWQGVLLIVAMAMLLCLRSWRSYSPRYQASASFVVQVSNPLYASQQYYNASAAEQMAKTFPYILTSGVLSEQVMETLGIGYMPAISTSVLGNTNIITMTVTSGDPQLAYDVLHCVMDVYPSVAEFVVGPTSMSLMDESGVPTAPSNRVNYKTTAVKGALVGAVIWMAIACLYWLTHQTVNSEDELRKVVNLSCLGQLPIVRGLNRSKNAHQRPVLTERNDKYGFNESVRLLRVRVEKAMAQQHGQVLLVTSTIANEGKTTVSLNLATALAQQGKRTLLVDCDLRNPSVSQNMNSGSEVGLTEYLRGKCSLEAIFNQQADNLYVVYGGKAVSNPETLLGKPAARGFMDRARERYDYVILDTPPCALMADASDISAMADCSLLTVRQGFATRQQILEGVQMLSDNGKPLIGCILNMTAPQSGKNYYNSYGYYGYGREKSGRRRKERSNAK